MKIGDLRELVKSVDHLPDSADIVFSTGRQWINEVLSIEPTVARYVLDDKQTMAGYYDLVELINGWHSNSEQALSSTECSGECFRAVELEFTRVPVSFVKG